MKLNEIQRIPNDYHIMKDHDDIVDWLKRMGVNNYEIENGIVNCKGNVNLRAKQLPLLNVQFGIIEGLFSVAGNRLASLRGCPHTVGDIFACNDNNLISFEFAPKMIGDFAEFDSNKITSLVGIADHIKKINGPFYADWNKIKSGGLGLLLIEGLKLENTTPKWITIIDKYLGRPDDIYECQTELIDNGFEAYAQL